MQYAAVLGDAEAPALAASHARNLRTAARQEPSAEKTWERKSQKVREGGKEPPSLRVAEAGAYAHPGLEERAQLCERVLAESAHAARETSSAHGHGVCSFRASGLPPELHVCILVATGTV